MRLTANDVDRFEASRPRLEAIAYRLLGSAGGGRAAYKALLASVQNGRISGERLLQSYQRLRALKAKLAS